MQKLYIIKIGGNVIDDLEATKDFLTKFASIKGNKVLVHGGGKVATQVAEKLGLTAQMIDGRRITDEAMLGVVTMVYGGLVNKNLVAKLQSLGVNALGLTGADAGCILAKKRAVGAIDYGYAGDIVEVNARQIASFIALHMVPVFAPLTYDTQGTLLNTNADTMAASLATALASTFETHLIYCFEKKGVLANPQDDNSAIPQLSAETYTGLKNKGIISKGMIPKLDNAFSAMQNKVRKVIICHAEDVDTVIAGNTATYGYGTSLSL